jgi:hypothetical protein
VTVGDITLRRPAVTPTARASNDSRTGRQLMRCFARTAVDPRHRDAAVHDITVRGS